MAISTSNCAPHDFFDQPTLSAHKKYEALRSFFYEKKSAEEVAKKFGYKLSYFYNLTRDFRNRLKKSPNQNVFFYHLYFEKTTENFTIFWLSRMVDFITIVFLIVDWF